MDLVVVRSGGVAGIRRAHALDTAGLEPAEARHVEQLVACAVAAPTPVPPAGPEPAADRFDYMVLIDATPWRVGEADLRGPWRELVHELVARGHRTAPPDC